MQKWRTNCTCYNKFIPDNYMTIRLVLSARYDHKTYKEISLYETSPPMLPYYEPYKEIRKERCYFCETNCYSG
jgi:hypothetical protein